MPVKKGKLRLQSKNLLIQGPSWQIYSLVNHDLFLAGCSWPLNPNQPYYQMEIKRFACHPPSVVKSTEKKSQTFRYDGIVNIIIQLHVIKVTRISLTMVASGQTKKNSSWWWMPCNLVKSASLTEWKIQPNRRFLFFEMRKSIRHQRTHLFTCE